MNQCDGCMAGMELIGGLHYYNGKVFSACSRNLYTKTNEVSHIPKGGMCKRCAKSDKDCSHLDFKSMPVIAVLEDCTIVKCTEFTREDKVE